MFQVKVIHYIWQVAAVRRQCKISREHLYKCVGVCSKAKHPLENIELIGDIVSFIADLGEQTSHSKRMKGSSE